MTDYGRVILTDIEGFARKSGIDQFGNAWIEYELELSMRECGCEPECGELDDCPSMFDECASCDEPIQGGWLCLDGGDTVCDSHVEYAEDLTAPAYAALDSQ